MILIGWRYSLFAKRNALWQLRARREEVSVMRKQVGILVAALLYYSGLVKLARWHMQSSGKRLIILNYHQASGGDLLRHMLYLKRHYRLLHLEEALNELYSPYDAQKTSVDRRTPLVLTFDDGYHDNYT